jgi:hypothetical protein
MINAAKKTESASRKEKTPEAPKKILLNNSEFGKY